MYASRWRPARTRLRPSLRCLIALLVAGCIVAAVWQQRFLPSPDCTLRLEAAGVNLGVRDGSQVSLGNSAREMLYNSIQQKVRWEGLHLDGPNTQGLTLAELFRVQDNVVSPRLHSLDSPVRAIVAPILDGSAVQQIQGALEASLLPLLPEASFWPQDTSLFHTTVWHASPHQHPVTASDAEVLQEISAVRAAVAPLCPISLVLDRVLVTQAGVVIACWQAGRGGSEPSVVRAALQAALPRAPRPGHQTVGSQAIWHTTLGRMLEVPAPRWGLLGHGRSLGPQSAARAMTTALCGLQVRVDRLWYVQERDLLALALGGRWIKADAFLTGSRC